MSGSADHDSQERFALGFLLALITLVVGTVVGTVVYQYGMSKSGRSVEPASLVATGTDPQVAPAVALENAATAASAAAAVVVEEALVRVDNGVVKFFFASGQTQLANGANEALADVLHGIQNAGKRAQVSGFHDATGNMETNADLAKQRAIAVKDALVVLGVEESKIELSKPAQTQADGNNAEARRVEVVLID